jgi:hypothetical protein
MILFMLVDVLVRLFPVVLMLLMLLNVLAGLHPVLVLEYLRYYQPILCEIYLAGGYSTTKKID